MDTLTLISRCGDPGTTIEIAVEVLLGPPAVGPMAVVVLEENVVTEGNVRVWDAIDKVVELSIGISI